MVYDFKNDKHVDTDYEDVDSDYLYEVEQDK